MGAQSALAVYHISDIAANTVGLLKEQNILTRSFTERATRSQQRITGFSGSTIWLNECDPVLTIDISGWMLARGGLANMHPGGKIDASIIANWRNGALTEGEEDHFGWDVMEAGMKFIARNPSVTRGPGRLSDFSITLALECTARGSTIPTLPGNNNTDPPPEVGTVWYLAVVYTDKGTYYQTSQDAPVTLASLFGSAVGSWGAHRYISGVKGSDPAAEPPIEVLGVAVSALNGTQSYLVGDDAEVTGGGQDLLLTGPDQWVAVYPFNDSIPPDRTKMRMVCGNLPTLSAMLAALDPPGSEDDFSGIYHHGQGWVKDLPEPITDNALEWFQT
ncbi:MAG: hypothetical protein EOP87_00210 [Verrucomicrobiaceae bacterium]|nr:MAG: hypothetical protein EOP87_00210 [Verrucomicrobiaceae bacterium]